MFGTDLLLYHGGTLLTYDSRQGWSKSTWVSCQEGIGQADSVRLPG